MTHNVFDAFRAGVLALLPVPAKTAGEQSSGNTLRKRSAGYVRLVIASWLIVLAVFGLTVSPVLAQDDEEIERLTRLLEEEPDRVDLLKQRGHLFRLEGFPVEALNDLNRAQQLDPNDPEVYLLRGQTLSDLRRDKEAESDLDQFLKREPGRPQVFGLLERARVRARIGRAALAIADYNAAIAIQPALELYLARGQLEESLGQLAQAAAGYRSGLARLGRSTSLTVALVRVEIAQGQFQSALTLINQELPRAPVRTLWLLRRAEVLTAMGRGAEAEADLDAALTEANRVLGQRVAGIHFFSRAQVLIALGLFEDARLDLQDCMTLAPGFTECQELLKIVSRPEFQTASSTAKANSTVSRLFYHETTPGKFLAYRQSVPGKIE